MLSQVSCEHQERLRRPLGYDNCCGQPWPRCKGNWQSGGCKPRQNWLRTKEDAPANWPPYLQSRVVDIGDNFQTGLGISRTEATPELAAPTRLGSDLWLRL